jgi:hypothetical protein
VDSRRAPLLEVQLSRPLRDAVLCVSEAASELTGTTRNMASTSSKARFEVTEQCIMGKANVLKDHTQRYVAYGGTCSRRMSGPVGRIARICLHVGCGFKMKYEAKPNDPDVYRVYHQVFPLSGHNHAQMVDHVGQKEVAQPSGRGSLTPLVAAHTTMATGPSTSGYTGFDCGYAPPTKGLPIGLRHWIGHHYPPGAHLSTSEEDFTLVVSLNE